MGKALILMFLNGLQHRARCFFYTVYDRSKSMWPIRAIFYRGGKYQHFKDGLAVGRVIRINGGSLDGDFTFELQTGEHSIHCEITPCFPIDNAKDMKVGDMIRVCGTSTYDPTHLGFAGHWEIHPVKSLEIL